MIQDGLWAAVAVDVSSARAAAVQRQIRPTKIAHAMQRRGDVMLRAVNRSFLGQAHVLGEPLVSADIEADERRELARRAAANIVVERRYLFAHLGIAQGRVGELETIRGHARSAGVTRSWLRNGGSNARTAPRAEICDLACS
jgi:hypothetical protein